MLKFTTFSLVSTGLLALAINPALAGPGCRAPLQEQTVVTDGVEQVSPDPAVCCQPVPVEIVNIDPQPVANPDADAAQPPLIQVALLLDTSGSMSGLIDQAKAQLWMIVNRFAQAKRDGQQPRFQIALYEYGNSSLSMEEGYIRQVVGFTDDLDALSEALFSLTTNGGSEHCGQVIAEAMHRLPWSVDDHDFKAIYIAGNEPFTQGPIDYKVPCEEASARGVIINTIHCGSTQAGISGQWNLGAQIAGGSYLTINQDQALANIVAPQDEDIATLNRQFNETYLPYGGLGMRNHERQEAQDLANNDLSRGAGADRAGFKATALYGNASWDLVDAYAEDDFDLEAVADEDLPEIMRGMTLEEKVAHIEAMAQARDAFREQMTALVQQRAEHVAEQREQQLEEEGDNLGSAINSTIDEQLTAQGFAIEEDEAESGSDAPAQDEQEAEREAQTGE